ncbi:MAG: radical SAM protein [Blautia sp.]
MGVEPKSATRLFKKAGQLGIPLHGVFELTPMCNMSCEMCYVRKDAAQVKALGGLISPEQWYDMGVQARDAGTLFLLLTGGEPFLYPGFRQLYEKLKTLGFMIAINSNGTLLDEEMVAWLADNAPYRLQITLYGASNETYKRLCHNPHGFDQVIRAIELMKKYHLFFKLNATMTPANICDLEEIYRIAKEYNVYVQATSYMFPPLRRDENMVGKGFRFSPEDAGRYMAEIDRLRFDDNLLRERIEGLQYAIRKRAEYYKEEDCGRDPFEPLGCRAGRSSFWLNWKGQMTACGMQNDPCSYPFRDGLYTAWEKIRSDTEKIRLPVQCTMCKNRKACNVCGASVYCENGVINNEAPQYVCRMTESYIKNLENWN